jgi:hypothetical protein
MNVDLWNNRWAFGAMLVALATSVGCVERRLTVRSVPANALVMLDGQEIGFTPCSNPFDYYGDRQIRLIKDGYETRTINQTISAPWYQWIGLDFVSEVLIPWRIRDDRNYVYELEPTQMVSSDELMQRAEVVREQGRTPPARVIERAGIANKRSRLTEQPEPLVAPTPPLGN